MALLKFQQHNCQCLQEKVRKSAVAFFQQADRQCAATDGGAVLFHTALYEPLLLPFFFHCFKNSFETATLMGIILKFENI